MNDILNPYIAGAPVVETSMFFGREDIFSWIDRSLMGKYVDHILVLHGQRRVGKTSVLKQIPNFLPKQYIQVFFDLQGRTNTTLDRFIWWIASEIVRTLKKECNLDLPKPDRNAFADPEAFITDFLPFVRNELGDKVLLLTFDEFDTLDRPDIQDTFAKSLIAYLKRLIEQQGLNFIFSIGSSGNKLENMQASYTDFFKTALYRKVSFLTPDDCRRLITKPVEGLITYEPKAVQNIALYTSGHPYFTQLMCHELFSRCQKTGSRNITAQDVEEILPDVIERGTVNLKFVWDEASNLEKWTLATLAQAEGAALRDISKTLKTQQLRFSEAELNSAILHLRDKDVLTDENHFVIHLLKLWLLTNRPMDRVREELVQVNPIADRYLEIGDEYRDRGQISQALQSYQQALAAQENNTRALTSMAAIHAAQEDHQKAADTYKQALRLDDENIAARQGFSQAQLALAAAALQSGAEDQAAAAYQTLLMELPQHAEARKLLADLFKRQGDALLAANSYEPALDKFQQALDLLPGDEILKQRLESVVAQRKAQQVKAFLEKADKALARQRWDEAAASIEDAIRVDPENQSLHQRLLEIKDAPRQEKIKAYKHEAEAQIAKGNYPKAISAIQTAMLLAPEDKTLQDWLQSIQTDQSNAQLRLYQSQAAQAETAGDWDGAIAAREAALKLNPQDERLQSALQATQAAKRQAQLTSLRKQADESKKNGRLDEAVSHLEAYLALAPGEAPVLAELEQLKADSRQAKVRALKTQAETAARQEKWEDAISAWQAYKAEMPAEAEQVNRQVEKARQKAALLKDYESAQGLIRKRQYGKAIHLLQGIIAQDPTYKSSSRLLVEAVEANKQHKPVWKQPWLYIGLAGLAALVMVVILFPQIKSLFSVPANKPTDGMETAFTSAIGSGNNPSTPDPAAEAFLDSMFVSMNNKQPTFDDGFDVYNPQAYLDNLLFSINTPGKINTGTSWLTMWDESIFIHEAIQANDFILELLYYPADGCSLIFETASRYSSYQLQLDSGKYWQESFGGFLSSEGNIPNIPTIQDQTYSQKLQMFVSEGNLAAMVNGELLFYRQDFDTSIQHDNQLRVACINKDNAIKLDEINFFSLDETPGFIAPVLDYANNIPPTTTFDNPSPEWFISLQNDMPPITDYLADGKLLLNESVSDLNAADIAFPHPDAFTAKDSIIKFKVDLTSFNLPATLIVRPRQGESDHNININFFPQENRFHINDGFPDGEIAEGFINLTYPREITIITLGNNLAVLVDGLLLGKGQLAHEYISQINDFSIRKFDDDTNIAGLPFTITFEDVRFWNLDGVDIVQEQPQWHELVKSYIDNTAPTFEDDFSSYNPLWGYLDGAEDYPLSDLINENEELIITKVGQPFVARFPPKENGFLDAHNFAISYDFQVIAGNAGGDHFTGFYFRSINKQNNPVDDDYYRLGISGYRWYLIRYDSTTKLTSTLADGQMSKETTKVLLIAYEDLVGFYLNDRLVAQLNISTKDIENYFFVENWDDNDSIKLDNIRFWNLDGVDISAQAEVIAPTAQPTEVSTIAASILAYINDTAPTFADDFSYKNTKWREFEFGGPDFPLTDLVKDEKLIITSVNVGDVGRFPGRSNGFLDAYNFALSYEFQVNNGSNGGGFYFRSSNQNTVTVDDDDYYRLEFQKYIVDPGQWFVYRYDSTNKKETQLASGTASPASKIKVLLIAFEDTVDVHLNDNLVAQLNDITTKDDQNYFFVENLQETDSIEIDNIQFWNLDGVDLETTQSQPQWHELVQAYTANTAPTFADDFSTRKQAWGVMSNGLEVGIHDEEISLNILPNVSFPTNGLFNADNFVMQFSYHTRSPGLSFKFRGRLWVKNQGYRIDLNMGELTLLEMEGEEILHTSGYSNEGSPTLLLYVMNSNIAIFIDGQMVYNGKTLTHTNVSQVNQFINSIDEGVLGAEIDDVFFWNLDGVDLSS